jgi:hypothetical protein
LGDEHIAVLTVSRSRGFCPYRLFHPLAHPRAVALNISDAVTDGERVTVAGSTPKDVAASGSPPASGERDDLVSWPISTGKQPNNASSAVFRSKGPQVAVMTLARSSTLRKDARRIFVSTVSLDLQTQLAEAKDRQIQAGKQRGQRNAGDNAKPNPDIITRAAEQRNMLSIWPTTMSPL